MTLRFTTDGLVIKETSIGDNDRLISIMTKNHGVISAYATGVKSIKSKRGSATGLLSYSNFNIENKGKSNRILEATANRVFFGAGNDIETLTIAQYFCELSYFLCPEDDSADEFLRLILNSLHFLTENRIPKFLIKAITELRIATISGYMPNIVACDECGKFEDDFMYFKLDSGTLYCKDCRPNEYIEEINIDVLKAMRHIVYSKFENIYSFSLSEDNTKNLSRLTEKYIQIQTERNYKTLDFLRSIVNF